MDAWDSDDSKLTTKNLVLTTEQGFDLGKTAMITQTAELKREGRRYRWN